MNSFSRHYVSMLDRMIRYISIHATAQSFQENLDLFEEPKKYEHDLPLVLTIKINILLYHTI